jgi:hypothetical protein
MRRRVASLAVAVAAVAAISPIAGAETTPGETSANASCVAILSDAEAQLFPAGFIGKEVSGFATSEPGVIGDFSMVTAKNHAGSLEGCIVP